MCSLEEDVSFSQVQVERTQTQAHDETQPQPSGPRGDERPGRHSRPCNPHNYRNYRRGAKQDNNFRGRPRNKRGQSRREMGRDTRQARRALELAIHPRPLDELHAERGYLFYALQSHDQRVLGLFRQLSALDEQISWYLRFHFASQGGAHQHRLGRYQDQQQHNVKVTVKVDGIPVDDTGREDEKTRAELLRQARRRRVWVRGQINAVVDAERALHTRLGEVNVEIQCQERWSQVERDREQNRVNWLQLQHPASQRQEDGLNYALECLPPDRNAWLGPSPNTTLGMGLEMSTNMHSYAQGYETGTGAYVMGVHPAPLPLHSGHPIWPGMEEGEECGLVYGGLAEYINWNGELRQPAQYRADMQGEQVRLLGLGSMNTSTNLDRGDGQNHRLDAELEPGFRFTRERSFPWRAWSIGSDYFSDRNPRGRRWSVPLVHNEWTEGSALNGEVSAYVSGCIHRRKPA